MYNISMTVLDQLPPIRSLLASWVGSCVASYIVQD